MTEGDYWVLYLHSPGTCWSTGKCHLYLSVLNIIGSVVSRCMLLWFVCLWCPLADNSNSTASSTSCPGELVNVSPVGRDVTAHSGKRHGGIHGHLRLINVCILSEMRADWNRWKLEWTLNLVCLRSRVRATLSTNTMSASAVFVLDLKGKVGPAQCRNTHLLIPLHTTPVTQWN